MFDFPRLLDGELMLRWANFQDRQSDREQWKGVECMFFDDAKDACKAEMVRRGFQT